MLKEQQKSDRIDENEAIIPVLFKGSEQNCHYSAAFAGETV
jgi:hypothetical protein